jgi:hypothetical protein
MELENENPITQKRRGRKPKTKEVEEEVAPKKRGRRPKDKSFTVINTYKDDVPEIEDDNIILHLITVQELQFDLLVQYSFYINLFS